MNGGDAIGPYTINSCLFVFDALVTFRKEDKWLWVRYSCDEVTNVQLIKSFAKRISEVQNSLDGMQECQIDYHSIDQFKFFVVVLCCCCYCYSYFQSGR